MDTTLIVLEGGPYHCTPTNWRGNGVWSNHAKLYAPTTGRAWLAVDERRTILCPGRLYLVPPHHRLSYGTDRQLAVDWLHFMPLSPLLDMQLAALTEVQCLPATQAECWRSVTRGLEAYFQEPTPAGTCRVQALLLDVVGWILERMPAQPGGSERLMPALRYMDDHITAPPRLAAIARTVNLSPEHFHRLFCQQFQTTPFEYLLRRRLAQAQRLLIKGVLSVKEVAAACGYDDPYYFSRLFRQRHGCTPRDVRLGKAPHAP